MHVHATKTKMPLSIMNPRRIGKLWEPFFSRNWWVQMFILCKEKTNLTIIIIVFTPYSIVGISCKIDLLEYQSLMLITWSCQPKKQQSIGAWSNKTLVNNIILCLLQYHIMLYHNELDDCYTKHSTIWFVIQEHGMLPTVNGEWIYTNTCHIHTCIYKHPYSFPIY